MLKPLLLRRLAIAALAVLPLATAAALYGHAVHYPLVFDDILFVRGGGLDYYASGLTAFEPRWFANASLGWTYHLFGADIRWLRAGNVLLHGLVGSALFLFLWRLYAAVLGPAQTRTDIRLLAACGALVFVCHPVAVYAVAYLIQRSIIMATLFGIAMLTFFLEGLTRRKPLLYCASAACYFLAVYAKEHAVLLPLVAAAMTPLVRKLSISTARELALPYALFGIIALAVILARTHVIGSVYEPLVHAGLAQSRGAAHEYALPDTVLGPLNPRDAEGADSLETRALPLSIINQGLLYFAYLALWILPNPGWMSIDIRVSIPAQLTSVPELAGTFGFVLYGLLAARMLLAGGPKGLFGFAALFPWLLFLIEFATVRFQEPFVLYRSYLWMAGLPAALPLLVKGWRPGWVVCAALLLCLGLAPLTMNRLHTFSSIVALWTDAIAKINARNVLLASRAYMVRGQAYLDAGMARLAINDFDEALRLNPDDHEALGRRGSLYGELGEYKLALADLKRAADLRPSMAIHYSALCLVNIRRAAWAEAIADCDRALAISPGDARAREYRQSIDASMTKLRAVLAELRGHLKSHPADARAYLQQGLLLQSLEGRGSALGSFRRACDLGDANGCFRLLAVD